MPIALATIVRQTHWPQVEVLRKPQLVVLSIGHRNREPNGMLLAAAGGAPRRIMLHTDDAADVKQQQGLLYGPEFRVTV